MQLLETPIGFNAVTPLRKYDHLNLGFVSVEEAPIGQV